MVGLPEGREGRAAPGGSRAGLSGARRGVFPDSEMPRRAPLAKYRARAWADGRSHARLYTALGGRSASRAGAGLIGRPEAMDPPSYANTRVCRT